MSSEPHAHDAASKYGVPLTQAAWHGFALRHGRFGESGRLEQLVAPHDAVLVWSGGKSDVTLHARRQGQSERLHFVRHGGMIDLLPKGTLLEEIRWRGQPSDCVSVSLDAESVERLLGTSAALEPDALRTALVDPHVVDLVQRLHAQAITGQPLGALYVDGLSLTLASYVYGRYTRPAPAGAPTQLPPQAAQRIVAFVEDQLGENITLTELAALVGYSPDHFARLFKRTFGRSPYRYVLDRRVERAKALLGDRSRSIAEVAVACGFGSQAHLHAAFKARTGVTPGAYRRG